MRASLLLLGLVLAASPVETKFAQLAPGHREAAPFERRKGQIRAVVLIHGFKPHPFSSDNVRKAEWHSWQKPDSALVQALRQDSDVYAYAYGQNATLDEVAKADDLLKQVHRLKEMGYREIVLVAHSSGGLIARLFVEDHPDSGVTKVVQVCAPNAGTSWAKATFGVRKEQEMFLETLSRETRRQICKERADKKIPEKVEFVCVVCSAPVDPQVTKTINLGGGIEIELTASAPPGDGVVACDSQWSLELQSQCIPAVCLPLWHNSVMRTQEGIDKIAELVRQKQPRWDKNKVDQEKAKILNGGRERK